MTYKSLVIKLLFPTGLEIEILWQAMLFSKSLELCKMAYQGPKNCKNTKFVTHF